MYNDKKMYRDIKNRTENLNFSKKKKEINPRRNTKS